MPTRSRSESIAVDLREEDQDGVRPPSHYLDWYVRSRDQVWNNSPVWPPDDMLFARTNYYQDVLQQDVSQRIEKFMVYQADPRFWSKTQVMRDRSTLDYPSFNLVNASSLLNQAVTNLLLKIGGVDWNAGVTLAESGKTAGMIAGAARSGGHLLGEGTGRLTPGTSFQLLNATAKGFQDGATAIFGRKWRLSKKIASKFLEYTYGWVPLFYDVYNAAQLAAEYINEPKHSMKKISAYAVEGSRKLIYQDEPAVFRPGQSGTSGVESHWHEQQVLVRCGATISVNRDGGLLNPTLQRDMGFLNPKLIAWELVPYSFVVDWFVGVGDYLEAQTALEGVTVYDAWYSELNKRSWEWEFSALNPIQNGYSVVMTGSKGKTLRKVRHYSRHPFVLDPSTIVPVWNGLPGMREFMLGMALFRQRLR